MKTGILGGTFNPIHLAHLGIAAEVRATCELDRVLFLPAATPPHKEVAEEVSFQVRLEMVEAAIADHPDYSVCTIEEDYPGKNYSVDTLAKLQQKHPDDEFYFIIGLDSFRDLPSWKNYQQLFEMTHLVVATRPGIQGLEPIKLLPIAVQNQFCYSCSPKKWLHQGGKSLIFLQDTCLDISSTDIRGRVAKGRSIHHLVPPQVADLIEHYGLYRD